LPYKNPGQFYFKEAAVKREQVIEVARSARTLAQIKVAQQAVSSWMVEHPEDWGVMVYAEQLEKQEEELPFSDPESESYRDGTRGDDTISTW